MREEMERLDALREAHKLQLVAAEEEKKAQRREAAKAKAEARKAKLRDLKEGRVPAFGTKGCDAVATVFVWFLGM